MIGTLAGRWLRRHRGVLIGLGVGLAVFEAHLLVVAEQFEGGTDVASLIEALPAFFRNLVLEKLRDLSADGIVSAGFLHPVVVMASAAVVCLFATAPAADREEGLLELVLSGPVSRGAYLAAALIDTALVSLALPLCLLAGAAVGRELVTLELRLPLSAHLGMALNLSALLFAIGGLALLFSATAVRRGPAVARLAALLLPLFLIEFLGFLWDGFDVLRLVSPFHYMQQLPVALSGESRPWDEVVLVSLGVVSAAWGCRRFVRHDV